MHVAEKIARAASAQLIRCADADDAPRVAIDGVAQKTVFLFERVYAALTENGQACIVFLFRRNAPDHIHSFSHNISPLSQNFQNMKKCNLF